MNKTVGICFSEKHKPSCVCGTTCRLRQCKWYFTNTMGIFVTSVILAVYIPTSSKQCIFQENYRLCYLIFVQHWTHNSVFLLYFVYYSLISHCWWGTLFMYFWRHFFHDTYVIWKSNANKHSLLDRKYFTDAMRDITQLG